MKCALRALSVVMVLTVGGTAFADTLTMTDGRKLEGEVTDGGDVWIVRSTSGIISRISKSEVVSVARSESAFDFFDAKWRELDSSGRAGDAEAWYELGVFARMSKLPREAKRAFERAVDLNPGHEGARAAVALSKGSPRSNGAKSVRWDVKPAAKKRDEVKRKAPVKGSGLKFKNWVPCPKCNGTGYEVWLTCQQCDQSERPGYLFFGNYVTICNRCNGKTKYPGFRCRYCGGHKKIDGDNPPKKRERHVPGGYHLCMKCQGTGVETWLECPQCGGSPWKGLLNMGEYVLPCNRCGARGRIPGIRCVDCAGHGIVADGK